VEARPLKSLTPLTALSARDSFLSYEGKRDGDRRQNTAVCKDKKAHSGVAPVAECA
jgi:hypothetical protein